MKVKYFPDTDTALVEFIEQEVFETKEISENVYVDLDQNGNLINMTIEHAKANAYGNFRAMGIFVSRNDSPNRLKPVEPVHRTDS